MIERQIFEGFHAWFAAPKEVDFLKNIHRHMFHVRVDIDVFHDDREIEFILFKRELQSLYSSLEQCNHRSCEMLCDDLSEYIYIQNIQTVIFVLKYLKMEKMVQ